MVRILAAGDFHGDKIAAEKAAKRALDEKADLIILNGDLVEEDNTEGVLYHFVKTGKPVLLVPGNHDWFATDFLAAKYKVKNLHGKSSQYEDVAIFGCGGANIGLNMLSEKEIYDTVNQAHEKVKKVSKKLLVSHNHPSGSIMETFSEFVKGSIGLRKAIEKIKPDIVICGHVHEAEGIEEKIGSTRVINAGKKGVLIDL